MFLASLKVVKVSGAGQTCRSDTGHLTYSKIIFSFRRTEPGGHFRTSTVRCDSGAVASAGTLVGMGTGWAGGYRGGYLDGGYLGVYPGLGTPDGTSA